MLHRRVCVFVVGERVEFYGFGVFFWFAVGEGVEFYGFGVFFWFAVVILHCRSPPFAGSC